MKANKKKLMITGISGLLGNNLAYYFRDKYEILGMYGDHPVTIEGVKTVKSDLLSEGSLKQIVSIFNPDIMIHCASLTNVDFCEMNPELTDLVNIGGTRTVVESIKNKQVKLVYISSDSVYDGCKGGHRETDPVSPQNYYGLSKYKGEIEALENKNTLIIRTNIYGWNILNKHSIAEWILDELLNKKQIKGFKDVFFSSIYNFDLVKILDIAIDQDLTGIFNCGSRTSLSKYEFAIHIADYFKLDRNLIEPISIDNYAFIAKRGKLLTLNVSKMANTLRCNFPTIIESLETFCRDHDVGLPRKIRGNHEI